MRLIEKPDYAYLVPDREFDDLKVCFLSRALGITVSADEAGFPIRPDFTTVNRIASHFPLQTKNFIFMNQVHSDEVINKTNKQPSFPTADAIMTVEKNLALSIKTADCVPLFLFDAKHRVIAAVHAGWRGTALKLAKKTLTKMEHFYRTDPSDLYAFIGPAIGPCCYEVGKEVYEHMHFMGKRRQDYFSRLKHGTFMMDLKGINAAALEMEGVPAENIDISDLCTRCRADLFFSYRRDGAEGGRNVSFIALMK